MVGRVRSEQDHADLLTYHMQCVRLAEAEVETARGPVQQAKAALSDKQEKLTQAFNAAKADLGRGYTREYLGGLLKDGRAKIRDLVSVEQMRARDKLVLNQPVYGQQPELFPGAETPTAARDEMAWEAEGYQRGLRGDLNELQEGDPPAFHQAVLRGYEQGQKVTGQRVARAMELKAREGNPEAGDDGRDLNAAAAEPEPGTPEAKKKERESIRRAKQSLEQMREGDDGAAGADFEASDEELGKQSTRKAVQEARPGEAPANDQPAAA